MTKLGLFIGLLLILGLSQLNIAEHHWISDTMDVGSSECVVTCLTTMTDSQVIMTNLLLVFGLVILTGWLVGQRVFINRFELTTQFYSPPRYIFETVILRE
ncbi:MAG: hypothetical protein ACD_41C00368G0009 [uncultured bacterium]|nr:MAG: hypothetical protein ACD_41C00368G0009 [uncultured bacterium]HBY73525.1 hypothetical protein [Candidatus Kerfeldbacteria bacterium]